MDNDGNGDMQDGGERKRKGLKGGEGDKVKVAKVRVETCVNQRDRNVSAKKLNFRGDA